MKTFLDELPSGFVDGLLPEYLKKQRWFGAKSRTIASASLTPTSLAGSDAVLATVTVTYDDKSADIYQLPLAISAGEAATTIQRDFPKSILAPVTTGSGPALLHDAVVLPAFRAELLRLTQESDDPETPASRVISAEQSNTSIIYGNEKILKLFRRLQPGENPDVEISRFLTHEAHFDHIPAYLGQLQSPDNQTLAFLQAFAHNEGDGWQWIQTELAAFYKAVATLPAPSTPTGAASFLADPSFSPEIHHHAATSLEAASLLGRRTAELHLALAHPTDDPAFAAEPFTPNDLAADSTRIHAQMVSALDAMKRNLNQVPADLTESATQLIAQRQQLFDRAHTLATASPYRFGRRIRIHGDYHLGQVLRTPQTPDTKPDFLIVDFEGEPARPLEERRKKQSPLRDVAGMLRSFSYSAYAALTELPNAPSTLDAWAAEWERATSAAFLHTYREVVAANPELIPQPEQAQALLLAFLLEKSLYELLYELNNRPTWLRIPLGGVLSLLREAA